MINQTLAKTAFNQTGLDAMGPASGQISAVWGDATPTFSESTSSLDLTGGTWRAPVGGAVVWTASGDPTLTDHDGNPIDGTVAVLRFHPQAALRLKTLVAARYSAGGSTDDRPTPFSAAIVGGTPPPELAGVPEGESLPPDHVAAGDLIVGGRLTFHDERGLIIDPVAVACLLRDLLRGLPAMRQASVGSANDVTVPAVGNVAEVVGLGDAGTRLHLVDLFGRPWTDHPGRAGVRIGTGGPRLGAGPHDWNAGLSVTDTTSTVRIGMMPSGTLGTTTITAPALPTTPVPAGSPAPTLERRFHRVAVVDLALHLAGNRSDADIDGVPGADAATRAEPAPPIASGDVEVLTNGQHLLGTAAEVAGLSGTRLAVSATIDDSVTFPATRTEQWPAVPATTATAEDLTAAHLGSARDDATGAYVDATADVVVSWPAGSLPVEAFVRVFPRVDPGAAVVPLSELGFSRRGDGGGAVVPSTGDLSILVPGPFRVGSGTRPADPTLFFDLLIVTRGPAGVRSRLLGSVQIETVGTGGTAPPVPAVVNPLTAVDDDHRGISPAPVIGLEQTAPPSDGTNPVLAELGEAAPREAPRFATMARNETIVAGHDGASPGAWTSVLAAAFLAGRSARGDARIGSPGLAAGPEDHAPGIRATARLGQELARAALRRTHHLSVGLVELDDGRWNPSTATGDATGAVLQSVAPVVDCPELSLLPESVLDALPDDWAGLIGLLGPLLPGSLSGLPGMVPTPGAGDRWVEEVRRVARAAKKGRRDTQWAWRWALSRARRLVYVETGLLSAAADGTEDHEVDLVDLLVQRLQAEPGLRVILVLPRRIGFGAGYESFAQRLYLARNAAVQSLRTAAEDRVVVYHPVGFPGRPEQLRGSFAVVDDVWALTGASTLSRRGLTFDGSTDVAWVGHDLVDGVSASVRAMRRNAMARVLGVGPAPAGSGRTPDPRWVRLADPNGAFSLMRETVANGGEGEIQPLWEGLPEVELPAMPATIADPEGRDFDATIGSLAAQIAALGSNRF